MKARALVVATICTLFLVGTANAATIWVSKVDGDNGDDGLSEVNAKLTIQGGIDAASTGDLILVKPGIYYESPTISAKDDIWLLAHPRGDARISTVGNTAARDGTATWTSEGDDRWSVADGGDEPVTMGYDDGTTQWFLPWLQCGDLTGHTVTGGGSCNSATPSIPERGFCLTGGDIFARFPNNDDPNGAAVIILPTKFTGTGLNLVNADDIIIDGFYFEAAQDACVDGDVNSTGTLIRNTEFEYCGVAAKLSTGGTVKWVRHSAPGLYDYEVEATHDFGESNAQAAAAFQLAKEYDPKDDNDCTAVALEGGFLQGFASTALTVEDVVLFSVFDGLTLDGQSGSTYSRAIFQGLTDNAIEFELDVGTGGLNNRVTDCYMIGLGFEPFSFQTSDQITVTMDHCILEFDSDDYQDNINRWIKNSNLHVDSTVELYNNLIQMQFKDFYSNVSEIDTDYTMRNNIFVADSGGGDGSPTLTVSNNIFVRATENTTYTDNDGIFLTGTSTINWVSELTNYAITSGSVAIDAGIVESGITDGFTGSAPDIGPFDVSETPGPVLTTWPRPFIRTYDLDTPAGWTGDLPPGMPAPSGRRRRNITW